MPFEDNDARSRIAKDPMGRLSWTEAIKGVCAGEPAESALLDHPPGTPELRVLSTGSGTFTLPC